MSEISEIIEREIAYWTSKNRNYKKYFEKRSITSSIMSIDDILQNNSLKDKIITDYIKGVALMGQAGLHKTEEYNDEIDKLTHPLWDIILKTIKSKSYQKHIFDAEITGKEVLQVNGVTTLLNMEELLLQQRREKSILLTPKDVAALKNRLITYKHSQHQAKPQIKPPKPIKPFEQYFAPKYREVLPELCKLIFNANNSQKDYAIMVCLLHEKYLLTFERANLYKSWYNFIERSFSTKESFAAINNHFIDTFPAYVCNESDIRYKQLKTAFEKALKDKNIK